MLSQRGPFPFRKDAKEIDEQGNTLMTPRYLKQICKEQKSYQTPALNDILYLHFKGFSKIENLDVYTGLKSLWLEGNGISSLSGLGIRCFLPENCIELRCLFFQQNCVEKIDHLETLENLDTLNLCNNLIKKIENLSSVKSLKTLQIAHNFLKTAEDIEHLRECKGLTVLDLSNNQLEDPAIIETFAVMDSLAVLNLMGNPVIRNIPNYRKTMIVRIKSLTYLDDRPVFEKERLAVEAWHDGGLEGERVERERQRQSEKEEHDRNITSLRRIQEENRLKRIELYGEEPENPVYPPALSRFRDQQLSMIDHSNTESSEQIYEPIDIALAAEPSELPAIRPSVVMDITGKQDEDKNQPQQGLPKPQNWIQEVDSLSYDLLEEISENAAVPGLEDATKEVERMRLARLENDSSRHALENIQLECNTETNKDDFIIRETESSRNNGNVNGKSRVIIDNSEQLSRKKEVIIEELDSIDFSKANIVEIVEDMEGVNGKAGWSSISPISDKDTEIEKKDDADEEAVLL